MAHAIPVFSDFFNFTDSEGSSCSLADLVHLSSRQWKIKMFKSHTFCCPRTHVANCKVVNSIYIFFGNVTVPDGDVFGESWVVPNVGAVLFLSGNCAIK